MTIALSLLSLALAADAFAASVAQAASARLEARDLARMSAAFGAAQGVMAGLGFAMGSSFLSALTALDHWIVLVLLTLVGAKMIHEAARTQHSEYRSALRGWALIITSIATSIDAAAGGLSLPAMGAPAFQAVLMIATVTVILTIVGGLLGRMLGLRFGKWAEIAGGLILIGLGIRIFVVHQFFGG